MELYHFGITGILLNYYGYAGALVVWQHRLPLLSIYFWSPGLESCIAGSSTITFYLHIGIKIGVVVLTSFFWNEMTSLCFILPLMIYVWLMFKRLYLMSLHDTWNCSGVLTNHELSCMFNLSCFWIFQSPEFPLSREFIKKMGRTFIFIPKRWYYFHAFCFFEKGISYGHKLMKWENWSRAKDAFIWLHSFVSFHGIW